jgi:hypothetical protein
MIISPKIVTAKTSITERIKDEPPKQIFRLQWRIQRNKGVHTDSPRVSFLQQMLFRVGKRIEALQRRYPRHLSAATETYQPRQNKGTSATPSVNYTHNKIAKEGNQMHPNSLFVKPCRKEIPRVSPALILKFIPRVC